MTVSQPDITQNPIHTTAIELYSFDINPLPVPSDGSKRTDRIKWPTHETTIEEIHRDFGGPNPRYTALAASCGPISNGLELLEVEGPHMHKLKDVLELGRNSDLGDLLDRLTGWTEISPSGGIHFLYRVEWGDTEPEGNKHIARTADREVIVETRGKGGMVVLAPSSGDAHPSGKPWKRTQGGPHSMGVFTPTEREAIFTLFGTLDETPPAPTPKPVSQVGRYMNGNHQHTADGEISPLNDFEAKADWADILKDWTLDRQIGHTRYWIRPGKQRGQGISATTGREPDRDRLYVFSSSTEFEPRIPYTKPGAYALLHHNGDHSAAASALRRQGYGSPRKPKARKSQDTTTTAVTSVDEENPTFRPSGQTRMAYRLQDEHAGKLKYADGIGWLVWDGTRWARDTKDRSKLAVLKTLRKALADSINDEQLRKDVRKCESAAGINGVLDIASALPQIRVAVDDLDADPYLLNTTTGTLDLHTQQLRPHNPDDLITKVTGTGYDPNATAPTWDQTLATSLPDPDVRAFLQRHIGQALTGRVLEHKLVIATGEGRNGKTLIANTVSEMLGDYAITANNRMLVAGRYKQQSAGEQASLMRLRGARFAVMSELEKGDRLAESTMKSLTGGDTIEAKFMHSNPVQFQPSHSFFMLTNDLPAVDADDHAVWARMLVIPFNVSFKGREDNTLEDRLKLELAGILTWAVQGLADYQQQGLNPPNAVLAKTNVYRYDNDAFAQFVADRCVIEPNQSITRKQLNIEHHNWALSNGVEALSAKEMVTKVKGLEGVQEGVLRGVRLWKGLGVKIDQPELD